MKLTSPRAAVWNQKETSSPSSTSPVTQAHEDQPRVARRLGVGGADPQGGGVRDLAHLPPLWHLDGVGERLPLAAGEVDAVVGGLRGRRGRRHGEGARRQRRGEERGEENDDDLTTTAHAMDLED